MSSIDINGQNIYTIIIKECVDNDFTYQSCLEFYNLVKPQKRIETDVFVLSRRDNRMLKYNELIVPNFVYNEDYDKAIWNERIRKEKNRDRQDPIKQSIKDKERHSMSVLQSKFTIEVKNMYESLMTKCVKISIDRSEDLNPHDAVDLMESIPFNHINGDKIKLKNVKFNDLYNGLSQKKLQLFRKQNVDEIIKEHKTLLTMGPINPVDQELNELTINDSKFTRLQEKMKIMKKKIDHVITMHGEAFDRIREREGFTEAVGYLVCNLSDMNLRLIRQLNEVDDKLSRLTENVIR